MSAVADTIALDIPPAAPTVPAGVPVFNGIPHLVPVEPPARRTPIIPEATAHLVVPPPPMSKEQEAAALRAAAEQLKASFTAQKAALQAQLDRLAAEEKAAKEAEVKAREAEYLARLASWNMGKVRALVMKGGLEAVRGLEQAISDGFLVMRKAKAPVPQAAPAASTPRPASTGKQTYSDDTVRQVLDLKSEGLSDKEIELRLGIGKGDGKCAWALRTKRAA